MIDLHEFNELARDPQGPTTSGTHNIMMPVAI